MLTGRKLKTLTITDDRFSTSKQTLFTPSPPEEKSQIDPADSYLLLNKPYDSEPYRPSQVNFILSEWFKDNGFALDLTQGDRPGFEIFLAPNSEQIALLKVVKDTATNEDLSGHGLDSLGKALRNYDLHSFNLNCKKIIIPVVALARGHFRLLVIFPDNRIARYYDSRDSLTSTASELKALLYQAERNVVEDYFYNVIPQTDKFSFTSQPTSWLLSIQKNVVNIIKNFARMDYVEEMTKKYFNDITFSHCCMADQAYLNLQDCGPLTVDYARQTALNDIGGMAQVNIDDARAWQYEYIKKLAEINIKKLEQESAQFRF